MKKLYLVLICLFFMSKSAYSYDPAVFLSPGIKLGYQVGEGGGFVYGLELSLAAWSSGSPILGVVSNIDFCNGNTKLHFGAEVSAGIIGIDIGPSFYYTEKGNYSGITLGLYSLVLVMPYYETTRFYGENSSFTVNQFGSYFKLPLPLESGNLNIIDAH